MNPERTLNECSQAIAEHDYSTALARLIDYYRWRIRGGFEPVLGDARAARRADEILVIIEGWQEMGTAIEG